MFFPYIGCHLPYNILHVCTRGIHIPTILYSMLHGHGWNSYSNHRSMQIDNRLKNVENHVPTSTQNVYCVYCWHSKSNKISRKIYNCVYCWNAYSNQCPANTTVGDVWMQGPTNSQIITVCIVGMHIPTKYPEKFPQIGCWNSYSNPIFIKYHCMECWNAYSHTCIHKHYHSVGCWNSYSNQCIL